MPESAEETYARVVAEVGKDGRLPSPDVTEWDIFPWEGDLAVKVIQPPVTREEPRSGEGGKPCWRCENPDVNAIWRNERWQVNATETPTGLPLVLFLETREHLDFTDLDEVMAAEFGRLTARLHRVMSNLEHIGRVHFSKWGDGGSHLHVWFFARTERFTQTRGSFAAEWMDIPPPGPERIWREDLRAVAARLATHDGKALV